MNLQAGIYQHFKGGLYQVIGISEHTETKERTVVYVALTGAHMPGPRIRNRPVEGDHSFFEAVKWPDGTFAPRFRFYSDGMDYLGSPKD